MSSFSSRLAAAAVSTRHKELLTCTYWVVGTQLTPYRGGNSISVTSGSSNALDSFHVSGATNRRQDATVGLLCWECVRPHLSVCLSVMLLSFENFGQSRSFFVRRHTSSESPGYFRASGVTRVDDTRGGN